MAQTARKGTITAPHNSGGERVDMRYSIPVTLEPTEDGFMAYNDELQVCAAGSTEVEAFENFQAALDAHVAAFGDDVLAPFARRTHRVLVRN